MEYTVQNLIEFLKTIDPKLPVGTIGHFGEFHPMNKYNFQQMQALKSVDSEEFVTAFVVTVPDVGPEPE